MKNILIPTDFSATAKNAALYALHLAKQVKANHVVLYNAYQQPLVADPTMAPVELIDFNELKNISDTGLEHFKAFVQAEAPGINITTVGEYAILADGLVDVCDKYAIDAMVMGVTGGSGFDEVFLGSTAVEVAKAATVPVIIVPPGVAFTEIKSILFACDFNQVVETTPIAPIKAILNETGAKLFVLNIDHANKHFTPETPFESLMLDTLLHGYNPEYHFADSHDFIDGINNFATEKDIDLIITIPKKHNLFERLFKHSHTKQLAFHSHIPLMVVHD